MAAARKRVDHVNEWLRVGAAVPADEYERLREAGVTHVVDLREEDEADIARLATLGIVHRHVPVPNNTAPTTEQLAAVADWFADEADDSSAMYVHCAGGFGRAGTMADGLLVHSGLTLEEAEHTVRAARPEISINDEQRAWLRDLEAHR